MRDYKDGKVSANAMGVLVAEAERAQAEANSLVASIKFYCRENAFRDKTAPVTEAALLEKAEFAKNAVAQAKLAIKAHAQTIK